MVTKVLLSWAVSLLFVVPAAYLAGKADGRDAQKLVQLEDMVPKQEADALLVALARKEEARRAREGQEAQDAHDRRLRAMAARWNSGYDRLRIAFEERCTAVEKARALSGAFANPELPEAATARDGLSGSIGESFAREVIQPADEQADQLIGWQEWARANGLY